MAVANIIPTAMPLYDMDMLRIMTYVTMFFVASTVSCMGAVRHRMVVPVDSLDIYTPAVLDSIARSRICRLTEEDYVQAARELGVETAVIKAVVRIEAGKGHHGFYKPRHPLINFDLAIFRKITRSRGINLDSYRKSHAELFRRPDVRKYGSMQAAQYARLKSAIDIDREAALESTFWGMFQIGGVNWKNCDVSSVYEFVDRMATSEFDQLELFVRFLKACDMVKYLKNKNWRAFARQYNGPSYARRGYHTRLAKAYEGYRRGIK